MKTVIAFVVKAIVAFVMSIISPIVSAFSVVNEEAGVVAEYESAADADEEKRRVAASHFLSEWLAEQFRQDELDAAESHADFFEWLSHNNPEWEEGESQCWFKYGDFDENGNFVHISQEEIDSLDRFIMFKNMQKLNCMSYPETYQREYFSQISFEDDFDDRYEDAHIAHFGKKRNAQNEHSHRTEESHHHDRDRAHLARRYARWCRQQHLDSLCFEDDWSEF